MKSSSFLRLQGDAAKRQGKKNAMRGPPAAHLFLVTSLFFRAQIIYFLSTNATGLVVG
jgi:hypothetical protein